MANKINYERRAQISALRAEGKNTREIGELIGVSQQSVSSMEGRMGVPRRKRGLPKNPEIWSRNNAIYEENQSGIKPRKLAKKYGLKLNHIYIIIGMVRDQKRANQANEAARGNRPMR